jgi:hypothetical protein
LRITTYKTKGITTNRNANLENLYSLIGDSIKLAESYSQIPKLFNIIKLCRLKPYNYIFKSATRKLLLYKDWVDEYGNMLRIYNGNRHKIIFNQVDIDTNKIIGTDLYCGFTINNIAKISKLFYLFIGKDDVTYDNVYHITFLGIDNYLRSFLYTQDNGWVITSPLLLGMYHLTNLYDNLDVKHFRECSNKENLPLPCIVDNVWLSSMPASTLMQKILNQHETLMFLLPKDTE